MLLTAGLAAGQAQATDFSGAATWEAAADLAVTNIPSGTHTISGGASNQFFNDIIIQSDATATVKGDSYVKGTLTINKGATLNIKKNDNGGGNLFGHYTVNDTLDSTGSLENHGTIDATTSSGSSVVEFHSIHLYADSVTTLGGTEDDSSSDWRLSTMLGAGAGVDDGQNDFIIDKGAELNLQDYSHTYINQNAHMSIDGKVTLTASANGSFAIIRGCDNYTTADGFSDLENATITIGQNAVITAASGSGSTGIFAPDVTIAGSSNAKDPATITVASGGKFTLDGDMTESEKAFSAAAKGAGQFTMTSGKINVAEGGTLIVGAGSYTDVGSTPEDESATTTLDIQGGELTGKGTVQVEGVIKISAAATDNFLGKSKDATGDGQFVFSGGKTVYEFKDQADLADYTWSGSTSAAEDFIVSGNGTVQGENLAISSNLKNASDADAGVNTKLSVKATNLTLGGGAGFVSADHALGVKDMTAQNVTFLADSGSNADFTLQEKLTLIATQELNNPLIVNRVFTKKFEFF